MAIGRKTGGRNFQKGQGGRPAGAKDRVPRTSKRAVEMLLEQFGNDEALIRDVLMKGLKSRPPTSFPYLRMVVEQNAGLPDQDLNVKTTVVHEYHQ